MAERGWGRWVIENALLEGGKMLVAWASAPALAMLSIYLGWAEHLPWPYIMAAAAVILLGVTWTLLGALLFRVLTTARDRLIIESWAYALDGRKDDSGRLQSVDSIQPILWFRNNALFRMSFIIERFDVSFEGKIEPRKAYRDVPLFALPNAPTWFRDSRIAMGGIETKNLRGRAELKIKYGRPGHERFEINQQVNLYLPFDQMTGAYGKLQATFDIQAAGVQQ